MIRVVQWYSRVDVLRGVAAAARRGAATRRATAASAASAWGAAIGAGDRRRLRTKLGSSDRPRGMELGSVGVGRTAAADATPPPSHGAWQRRRGTDGSG